MPDATEPKARIVWQEPSGNRGQGSLLPLPLARTVARAYRFDEPDRQVWVVWESGYREDVEV